MVRIIPLTLALLFTWTAADAAVIKQVKENRVLLSISANEKIEVGSTLSSRSTDGKRKALMVVQEVKGQSAIAEILSGAPQPGDDAKNLEREQQAKAPSQLKEEIRSSKRSIKPQQQTWQVIAGLSQQTQTVTLRTATPLLQGQSFLLRGSRSQRFLDWDQFEWEAGLGLEQLKAIGSVEVATCSGSTSCSFELLGLSPFAKIGYLPFGTSGRHLLLRAGPELVLPISVSSNVVQKNGFVPLIFYSVGVSTRIGTEVKDFVPLGFDIAFYQSSGVTLTRMILSLGYGW